ncbi:hypothetical protein H7X68_02785 [Candidatus Saccharibacteria bacterium]|nr:hypothetical protein [Candidatus Saccharibacteria bacterium]
MLNKSHSPAGTIASALFSVIVLAFAGWLVWNRQYAFDQWTVWSYQPTTSVASIVERTAMSPKGEFYFYASRPAVNTATEFNENCKRQEAKSAILACYSSGRIYIYDIANAQLDGIKEVSAIHETLHAVWERMSDEDKKSVGVLLEAEYIKIDNPELKERMAYYDRNEPGEHLNELHSIVGTEISDIGSELEAHYAQYFTNRSKIIALHAGYQALFNNIRSQTDGLLVELNALNVNISAAIAQYTNEAALLKTETDALRNRSRTINRSNSSEVNAFNATRESLLERISQLESSRLAIDKDSAIYNTKRIEYNKLVISSNALTSSIDSTLVPVPSL